MDKPRRVMYAPFRRMDAPSRGMAKNSRVVDAPSRGQCPNSGRSVSSARRTPRVLTVGGLVLHVAVLLVDLHLTELGLAGALLGELHGLFLGVELPAELGVLLAHHPLLSRRVRYDVVDQTLFRARRHRSSSFAGIRRQQRCQRRRRSSSAEGLENSAIMPHNRSRLFKLKEVAMSKTAI